MKLYSRRILKTGVARQLAQKTETQDAILWSVQAGSRLCSVKIQGSGKLIQAYYPENWQKTPSWLKPGNAVKIMHTGGQRGRIEIIGHGLLLPTPQTGDDDAPTPATPEDAMLTGGSLYPAFNDEQMVVLVGVGTYRINGVVYTLDAIPCNSDVYDAEMGGYIDTISGAFAVPAAPSAQKARYDAIEVGIDGILHYLSGTPSTAPTDPAISVDHVQVGTRLIVNSGTTAISSANIGGSFVQATAYRMTLSFAPSYLDVGVNTSTITVTIYDQYGSAISSFYVLDAEIINSDDGTIQGGDAAGSTANRTGTFSSTTFTYTRGTTDVALIQFTLHTNVAITATGSIFCYSST